MRVVRVALIMLLVALSLAGCGAEVRGADVEPGPRVTAVVPVGEADYGIEGIAVGEGAVWAAVGPFVDRIDPVSARVTNRLRLARRSWAMDVEAGEGAAWVATEGAVLRLDRGTADVVATIELPRPGLPYGLGVGEGGVWVSVAHGPRSGEVIRIDPDSNEVVARITTPGHAGELEVGAGAVWVLSHPEYTDETEISETSLHRIDPDTNELVATLMREPGVDLGGAEIPRLLASDAGSVWVRAFEQTPPHHAASIRVDAASGDVSRQPLGIKRFSPFGVDERGVWFFGPDADVSLLNPETMKVEESVDVDATVGDADLDPATGVAWLASLASGRGDRSEAIRVDLGAHP